MMDMPKFLRRPLPKGKTLMQVVRENNKEAKRVIVMPKIRSNPVKAQRSKAVRLGKRDEGGKVTHPTTEAVKAATAGLTNGKRRKALYKIAKENGIGPEKWDHLNVGQVAMNLTNTLRGRYYKMETIIVKGKEIA